MIGLRLSEKDAVHKELDRVLEVMSLYDSADASGKHHIADEIFGFLDYLAGSLIERQLRAEGCASFSVNAFHLDEADRPNNWPASEEERKIYRARVLISLVQFMRAPLNNIDFSVLGVNRDLLSSTCDHKYTPKYLPVCKRGPGKDDNDDRRIMARLKFTLGIYAEKGSTKRSIKKILDDYRASGVPITEGTWKNLKEEISFDVRASVQEAGEDSNDYSSYDLPEDLQGLFQVAVQLK